MANQLTRKDRKRLLERQKQLDAVGKRDDNEIFLDQKRRIHRQITSLNVIDMGDTIHDEEDSTTVREANSRTKFRRQKNVDNILKEVYVTNNEAILNEDTNMRILKNLSLNANRSVELSPVRKMQFKEKQNKFDEITSELRYIIDELNNHKEGIPTQKSSETVTPDSDSDRGIFDVETARTSVNLFAQPERQTEYDELRELISDTMPNRESTAVIGAEPAITEPVTVQPVPTLEKTQPIPRFTQPIETDPDADPLAALLEKRRLEQTTAQPVMAPTVVDSYEEEEELYYEEDEPSTQDFIVNTAQMVFGALKEGDQDDMAELTESYQGVADDFNAIITGDEEQQKMSRIVKVLMVILAILVVAAAGLLALMYFQGNMPF
ncbi:hypothetical protein [Culicoidibacter larvae]|uniref:Uncharacterized protein n=1 Tax=Culicoidibacter larvae TaxID=2579976 RepID=A0A5R8QAT4_9FIRM|nr:hypothetical protein [Culicoidibacter larvae]TLG72980.1 hypothetical protein FEZ08_08010 [Culicoidibacter larvae]